MIEEWITTYLREHTDIILSNPEDYIGFIESLFISYGINITVDSDCLKRATILQFRYLLENTYIVNETSSNISSQSITNYSVSYKNTNKVSNYISPLAFNLLVACGLISSIVGRC